METRTMTFGTSKTSRKPEAWTALAPLAMEPYFSTETAEAVAAVNERIGTLLAERADLDRREAELAQADPADLGAELRRRWRDVDDGKADALAKEVALRGELRKYTKRCAADAQTAAAELQTKMDAERDRLAAALVQLGFAEAAAPSMAGHHPSIIATAQGIANLRSVRADYDAFEPNNKAMEAARRRLDELCK